MKRTKIEWCDPRGRVKTGRRGLRRKNAAKSAARKETKVVRVKPKEGTGAPSEHKTETAAAPGADDFLFGVRGYDEPIMPPDERVHGIPAAKRRRYLAVIEEIIDAAVSYPPLCAETAEKLCAALSAMLVDGFLDEVYGNER
ncbi:MAG: hypothetical protein LBS24_00630 [Clostridiales Family XIII bacterium]|jgi:hypothetical protein|nr:hypothetical protein [Clostridiales Family XIII bacterium]